MSQKDVIKVLLLTVCVVDFNAVMSLAWNVAKEWMMTDNMEVISRVLNKFQNKRRL